MLDSTDGLSRCQVRPWILAQRESIILHFQVLDKIILSNHWTMGFLGAWESSSLLPRLMYCCLVALLQYWSITWLAIMWVNILIYFVFLHITLGFILLLYIIKCHMILVQNFLLLFPSWHHHLYFCTWRCRDGFSF